MPRYNPDMPVIDPAANRLLEVKHRMVQDGNRFECSHYYISDVPYTPSTAQNNAFALAWWTQIKTDWHGMSAFSLDTDHVVVKEVLSPVIADGVYIVPNTDVDKSGAQVASPRMPLYVSQAFTRISGVLGQKGRGQCRYPGLYESAIDGDQFSAAHVLLQTGFVASLVAPINQVILGVNVTFVYAVANYTVLMGVVTARGGPAMSVQLPRYVGTQNSRKFGRGM